MIKGDSLKQISTIVNDDYISKIDEIFDNVKNVTLEIKINKYKKLEFENNVVVLLEIEDKTGSMFALLNISRDDENLLKILYKIVINSQFRIMGDIQYIDDKELNNICENKIDIKNYIKDGKIMFINGIQSIKDIYEYEKVELFGISIVDLYEYNLKDSYEIINKNTNYLKNISYDEVKEIKFSYYKDVIILLKNGFLIVNGIKELDNIKTLGLSDGSFIYSISNDNTIFNLTNYDGNTKFINNGNYKYKKIISTVLGIATLTYENTVRFYGTIVSSEIDYNKFYDVKDIGYSIFDDEIVIIKNNKVIALFNQKEYDFNDIVLKGNDDDYLILESREV